MARGRHFQRLREGEGIEMARGRFFRGEERREEGVWVFGGGREGARCCFPRQLAKQKQTGFEQSVKSVEAFRKSPKK